MSEEDVVEQDVTAGLEIGSSTRSMGRTITEGEFCILNSLSWSLSELHTNRESMRSTDFGERLLAGPMLLAIVEGLHDSSDGLRELEEDHGLRVTESVGITARYRAPVLPGDTLRVETELAAAVEADEPGVGVLTFRDVTTNQRDEVVSETERRFRFVREPVGD